MAPGKLQPALLGGAFIGVLSALPLVNLANCCCLWLFGGGMLTAYLVQERHPEPILAQDGALAGLLAGLVGACVYLVVAAPFALVWSRLAGPWSGELVPPPAGDLPPELVEAIARLTSGLGGVLLMFVWYLIAGMLFASLGGLVGAVIFQTRRAPSAPASPPPLPPHGG